MGSSCTRSFEPGQNDLPLRLQVERVLQTGRERDDYQPVPEGVPTSVTLNVYDVGEPGLRRALMLLRSSDPGDSFYCGLEIHGCEWSFGGEQRQWGFEWTIGARPNPTGITCAVPRESKGHIFSESFPLGSTLVTDDDIVTHIQQLGSRWPASNYDPVKCSCLHFCDALCERLGVGKIPEHVRSLSSLAYADASTRSLACCQQVLCSCEQPVTGAECVEEDLLILQRQLEHATLRLQQTQRDLASERANHDDAIRQVLELKRQQSSPSCRALLGRTELDP